eukprot:TRINITY_DN6387_c0_g1_i1.p1 TRINITY_DN6387_c0_g1~~TRINITY_DN6387_c0_g1_i1.p1  ORF type:complete len:209 (+),score=75.30 TRINITY_DN6387_c0_g1_i1:568-1194(+)
MRMMVILGSEQEERIEMRMVELKWVEQGKIEMGEAVVSTQSTGEKQKEKEKQKERIQVEKEVEKEDYREPRDNFTPSVVEECRRSSLERKESGTDRDYLLKKVKERQTDYKDEVKEEKERERRVSRGRGKGRDDKEKDKESCGENNERTRPKELLEKSKSRSTLKNLPFGKPHPKDHKGPVCSPRSYTVKLQCSDSSTQEQLIIYPQK